jgi:hypothetical protein
MRFLKTTVCASFVLLFTFRLAAAQTVDPSILEQCEKLLPPDRPTFSGTDAPSIRISAPADGSDIYGTSVTVSVDIQNFDVSASSGGHWHLWVNGQLQGMVYQKDVTLDLTPGENVLCATLGDTNHADIGTPAGIRITVHEAAAGTPTTPPSVPSSNAGRLIAEPGITPGQVILIVGVGLLAAVGGWWMGSRLPKRKR